MIAYGHFNFPQRFVWVHIWDNILTLSPQRGEKFQEPVVKVQPMELKLPAESQAHTYVKYIYTIQSSINQSFNQITVNVLVYKRHPGKFTLFHSLISSGENSVHFQQLELITTILHFFRQVPTAVEWTRGMKAHTYHLYKLFEMYGFCMFTLVCTLRKLTTIYSLFFLSYY